MRIAVVCDDMTQRGGQERLILGMLSGLIADHEVELYTPLITAYWRERVASVGVPVHSSFLQYLPGATRFPRFLAICFGQLVGMYSFELSQFDLVLSVSARFGHLVTTTAGQQHVCYMNSPGRMFWEPQDYFGQLGAYGTRPSILLPILHMYRLIDFYSAQRVDKFIANSAHIQRKISKYYRRESAVLHPYSDLDARLVSEVKSSLKWAPQCREGFYLVITRLNSWKRVDIAIEAVGLIGGHLKIIGQGPEKKRLQQLAQRHPKATIEFLGYVSEEEKIRQLLLAKAVIITQQEDFGLVPLEAKKCGTPVIAYRSGGVVETVREGIDGWFFDEQNTESLSYVLSS